MSAKKQARTAASDQQHIERVLAALRRVSGTDFSDFRETTLQRRITRRMGILGIGALQDYADLLEHDDAEVRALFDDVLINVTGFFRDPEVFETLKQIAFPEIIAGDESDGIRLWVPGASTGEEPFSLAIALSEALEQAGVNRHVQIFATDLNEKHIAHARVGTYAPERLSLVSPERLAKYFERTNAGWRVSKQIRQMCVFALHDLTRDPPFTRIDLVSCRNLLIYWNRNQQDRILPLFHYALRPDGFLLLGSAESAARLPQVFDLVDSSAKLYRRCPTAGPFRVNFDTFHADRLVVPPPAASRPLPTDDVIAEAGRLVAREDAMAAVLIDPALNTLYYWGQTHRLFAPSAGESSKSLTRVLAHELLADALSAIEEARGGMSAWRGPIELATGDAVFLHVSPLRMRDKTDDMLVLIDPQRGAEATDGVLPSVGVMRELEDLREDLAAKVEELGATNEELRTSEDQLRDANRALLDANMEQQRRNADLEAVNDDLENVLSSVRIPLVVLDGDGCVRTFTPPAGKLLGLRPEDVGRMLTDLNAAAMMPELGQLVAEVSFDLEPRENQFVDEAGRAHLLRVSPYVSGGQTTGHGVVLAFLDVELTRRRALEESSRLMSALISINATMNSMLDAGEIMRSVMVEAGDAIGADTVVLYRREEEGWLASYSTGLDEEIVGTVLSEGEFPYLTRDRRSEPWSVRDVDTDPSFRKSPLRLRGSRSIVAIQLVMRDEVVGALVFGFRHKTRFSQAKLDFVGKLGTAVSIALENARLYAAQRHVAERLQEALLQLPADVAGVDCAARYQAAAEEALVGGDFYDIFEIGDHHVALVIGDVMGKGLDAATMTALAKNALRAHALEDSDPAEVLSRANRLVHRFTPVGTFLTAFFGLLDTRSGQLTYASAGHPPALVLRPTGAGFLKTVDPILGAFDDADFTTFRTRLGRTDTLLLYTDGIIEARKDGELFGEERLRDTVSAVSRANPEKLLEAVMDEVLSFADGHLRDDVALLAIRRRKPDRK